MNHEDNYLALMERVRVLMNWDHAKAMLWMSTENPLLGGIEPAMMIIQGNGDRLARFIKEAETAAVLRAQETEK